MHISRATVELMAAMFGEQSLARGPCREQVSWEATAFLFSFRVNISWRRGSTRTGGNNGRIFSDHSFVAVSGFIRD